MANAPPNEEIVYVDEAHVCEFAHLILHERHLECTPTNPNEYRASGEWGRNEISIREKLMGSSPDGATEELREALRAVGIINERGQWTAETMPIEEETAMFPPWLRYKARALIVEERYRRYRDDLTAIVANFPRQQEPPADGEK